MASSNMAAKVLLLLTLTSLAFYSAVAARSLSETQQVPALIAVPQDSHHYKVHLTVHAKGYQYYRFDGTAWVQFNATARLYDSESKKHVVGRHLYLANGAQPTWESIPSKTSPGVAFSSVTGKVLSKAVVAASSIPWVLLQTTLSTGSEKYFGEVAFVQRVDTALGLAPTAGASVGDVTKSPYTADYVFYICES